MLFTFLNLHSYIKTQYIKPSIVYNFKFKIKNIKLKNLKNYFIYCKSHFFVLPL